MTNGWNDIANADCIVAIGGNPAENHPASFGHIMKAKERGAKLISIDPRFTRTSAKADLYAPLRSGTDVAFIGGMIKYILDDMDKNPQNYNMTYVREYTNASFLVNTNYRFTDGLFSGYSEATRSYDKAGWQYQLDENGIPKMDKTLKDLNCVFQLMKKHYARYDADTVVKVTGTPKDTYLEVCQTFAATGQTGKAGTILYAMGATQHTNGSQVCRSYCVLQLLLANIGVAGGGVLACRGESNVQGSTDYGLLYHLLTGYLKAPINKDENSLEKYLARITPTQKDPKSVNWWQNTPKYVVSLLKAWYGDAATKDNEFGFKYLPKNSGDCSWLTLFEAMYAGDIKGLMCWGQNPAVGGPNANMERKALENLDWLVAVDLWETETSTFWKRPGVDPTKIKTEVFLLPASASMEKEGSVTNSGRWMQWRYKCGDSPGVAEPDLWMMNQIMLRLIKLYKAEGGPNAEAITKLAWNYGEDPDPNQVAKEINGYDLKTGKLMASFAALQADGTTTCGCWVYSGSYTEDGNMSARRDLTDPSGIGLYPKWAWAWPVNRRIVYNRASVDLDGNPWDKEHPVIKWDAAGKKWVGDIADGAAAPMSQGGSYPFIMNTEGLGKLFGGGLADGPFSEHYEPWESPVDNLLSKQQNDPVIKIWASELDFKGDRDKYPIVCTTYRVVEHWQAGAMTRNLPWLAELMPDMFVELSEELAAEKGIKSGDKVTVETARGQVTGAALITKRFKPFQLNGKTVHEVGMPWHWGYNGLVKGDSANLLTPHIGDANTMIPEYKAFLCDIRKA